MKEGDAMLCKSCGKKLKENEKFCTTCGYYNDEGDDLTIEDDENINLDYDDIETSNDEQENSFNDDFPDNDEKEEDILFIEKQLKSGKKKSTKKVISNKIANLNKEKDILNVEETYDNELEPFIESYIGEDYRSIKNNLINVYALFFNWLYVLYRKLYITGIIGLGIIPILIYINPIYCLIYIGISMIVLGIFFNYYYQLICKIKVTKIVEKAEEEDSFTIKDICKKKGGVNVYFCLSIYTIILSISIFVFVKTQLVRPKKSLYWKENSENQANCISITKQSYKDFKKSNNDSNVEEAACRVVPGNPKQFQIIIYFSANDNYYTYYLADGEYLNNKNDTRNIELLEQKEKNMLLTEEEKIKLEEKRSIIEDYKEIIEKSLREDELIEKGKEISEKSNYKVSKEEILR